jgi:glutamate N-acetyltransferase/amino-acid N-acetyltransferase
MVMSRSRHITLPRGFTAAGVRCGVKVSGKEDLAVIAADRDAAAAIVTTQNQVVGAPVIWCRKILPRGYGKLRGIVINSGGSNVCTGRSGLKDAATMATETAKQLGTKPQKILVASTGVIGQRLDIAKIRTGIAAAARTLGTKNDPLALRAIMTTDTREKSAVETVRIGGKKVTVAGMAKGSGMIAPSMATMIALLTTDAAVSPPALHRALKAAVAGSFNTITIDSDTSTSDIVVVFASGAAGNKTLTARSPELRKFTAAMEEVCKKLARMIVADGEGATKVIEITVRGARSAVDAEIAAKSVANSPLVKCAVHGCDPNWGRIVMALGKSPAKIDPQKLSVKIGPHTVFSRGGPRNFDEEKVSRYLRGSVVCIACELGLARGTYTALTCDLSREYVTINAEYRT